MFSLGPIEITCSDATGISTLHKTLAVRAPVVILPQTPERLAHFKIRPRKTKPWPGEIVARKVGLGIDNYSIREYLPGDSFRRINWRASARTADDELLLNEQSAELGADTIVIVDARPASDLSSGDASLIKYSIRGAISIADKLLRDRNRVGLVTIGMDSERIPPGYGRRQYTRLVLSLIKLRAGGFFTFENIPSYLKYFYPHLAQVVLVSPLVDSGAYGAAAEIARSGYELLILSPNPVDFSSATSSRGEREKRRTLQISIRARAPGEEGTPGSATQSGGADHRLAKRGIARFRAYQESYAPSSGTCSSSGGGHRNLQKESISADKVQDAPVRRGEIYSFVLVAGIMLSGAIDLPAVFWLFVLFALVDGAATLYRIGIAISVNRIAFAFVFLLLSSVAFGVVTMILETIVLIGILDLSFLLRQVKQHTPRDFLAILNSRLGSYLYTLVPAGIFSGGILYLASPAFSSGVPADFAITLLGISSVAAFLVILFVASNVRPQKA